MTSALLAFSRFELELFFKTFIAVFFTYVAPAAIYATAIGSQAHDMQAAATNFLPVVVGLIIVFVSLFTLASQLVGYREMGFYKRILITRINPVGIALSNAIRGYVLALIGLIVLTLEARLAFGVVPQFSPLGAVAAIAFAGGTLFLLGVMISCFVKRSPTMFALASVFSYILVFFSGARPRVGHWLDWADYVDQVSPSYHALRVLQVGFSGHAPGPSFLWSVGCLVLWMAGCLLVIRRRLSWM